MLPVSPCAPACGWPTTGGPDAAGLPTCPPLAAPRRRTRSSRGPAPWRRACTPATAPWPPSRGRRACCRWCRCTAGWGPGPPWAAPGRSRGGTRLSRPHPTRCRSSHQLPMTTLCVHDRVVSGTGPTSAAHLPSLRVDCGGELAPAVALVARQPLLRQLGEEQQLGLANGAASCQQRGLFSTWQLSGPPHNPGAHAS